MRVKHVLQNIFYIQFYIFHKLKLLYFFFFYLALICQVSLRDQIHLLTFSVILSFNCLPGYKINALHFESFQTDRSWETHTHIYIAIFGRMMMMSFICHIHNYTEYNEEWNVFSAFNPSKCTHLEQWAAEGSCAAPGEQSWISCRSRDSNPQPWVTSGFKSNH